MVHVFSKENSKSAGHMNMTAEWCFELSTSCKLIMCLKKSFYYPCFPKEKFGEWNGENGGQAAEKGYPILY